jgi:hypothetical protein
MPIPSDTTRSREVDCPRCHAQCGWCSDYRWMHGKLPLSGGGKSKCGVKGFDPEGDACAMCGGSRKVRATTSYERLST